MVFAKNYSDLYDTIYKKKPYLKESKNLISIIQSLKPSTNALNILDYGCGTGKHIKHISKNFNKCFGYDVSKEMLKFAKLNNTFNNLSFHNNLNKIEDKKIDIVIMLFDVFSYFINKKLLNSNMRSIKRITNSNSILLFEFWYKKCLKRFPPTSYSKIINIKNNRIYKECIVNTDYVNSIAEIQYKFSNKNKLLFAEKHKVKFFDKKEIKEILHKYNFKVRKFSYLNDYSKTAKVSNKYSILCTAYRDF